MDLTRTIIIGNSGSGKSWLSDQVARQCNASHVDLDHVHWLPGGYSTARARGDAVQMVKRAAAAERWVIEGIYDWLIDEILVRATTLIWLCPDDDECVANIQQRGIRRGGNDESFFALLRWAASYRSRGSASSYTAHARLFSTFQGDKIRLHNRGEIGGFAHALPILHHVLESPSRRLRTAQGRNELQRICPRNAQRPPPPRGT